MDTILAKRNLANQQNTAQLNLNHAIERLVGSARETEFILPRMPLHGEVNLSALGRLNVKSIVTKEPGRITEVRGIPNGLSNFQMDRQLLFEVKGLPKSLETLNLDGNYITHIDVSHLNRLKILRISDNRLTSVGILPESLEELYVDNNELTVLNLRDLEKLRVLHCRNNKLLRIENIPASMVDLVVEEGNPHIILDYAFIPSTNTTEDSQRAKGTESEFVDALHKYFQLKTKYEEGARIARITMRETALRKGLGEKKARKLAMELKPKCVNCRRPVGSVFKMVDDRLLAHCGDANKPCALRIEIFKSRYENDDSVSKLNHATLLDTKDQIIRQKMDVLFNYSSEEETVKKFKELIEDYNLYSFLHKTDIDMREYKRFNVHKKELIKVKLQRLNTLRMAMNAQMDLYNETENRDALHAAMDIYIREYLPETHNLRMMKFAVMEMIQLTNADDSNSGVLHQQSASIRELENMNGEVPRVLKFTVGQLHEEEEAKEEEYVDVDVDADSDADMNMDMEEE